ncbi:MAG TPA: hypothetical protein VFF26_15070 [Gallionella sp.]|nr:hypothetical protein [Gallionella sp.]
MSNTKWKDSLLKSSLPLEHLVAASLAKLDWDVWGQFTYSRKNESGIATDFSADLHAFKEYSTQTHWLGTLQVLIECKYASPGVRWVFLPYPETAQLFSGVLKVFDQVANKRVTTHRFLSEIENDLEYCIRGISIYDSGFDENAIQKGASQLRYAMPRIAERFISGHAHDWHDEDIVLPFACAILVTTAPIYCLKQGLTLENIYEAGSLDEVVVERDAVVLWEESSPDRERYVRDILNDIPFSDVCQRIATYEEVFVPTKKVRYPPSDWEAKRAVSDSGNHVLVINVDRLDAVLKALDKAVKRTLKRVEKIAEVRFDKDNRQAVISALEK